MMKMDLKKRGQRGASLIEFAIVLPILVVLLLGIIELGFLLFNKAMITNASREGARAAILFDEPRLNEADITTVVNNYCQDQLITFGSATPVTDAAPDTCPGSGASITVTVDYQYDWLVLPNLPYATALVGPVNLSAATVMRCE